MENWCSIGPAYDQALRALVTVLEANRPPGNRTFPEPAGAVLRAGPPEYIGVDAAIAVLEAAKHPDGVNPSDMPEEQKNYQREAEGREINRLLGPAGVARIAVPDMGEAHAAIRAEIEERRKRLLAEIDAIAAGDDADRGKKKRATRDRTPSRP